MSGGGNKIVVLGMMTRMPVGGVIWQTIHYLLGLQRLGYEPYYVETHALNPSMFTTDEGDNGSQRAAAFLSKVMHDFDLDDRWAYHALHDDGRYYGLSQERVERLYASAALIINLHGGTEPRPELSASGRLVYLQTDPVMLQVELHNNFQYALDFLEPHCAYFTFAENAWGDDCGMPLDERFNFHPTRQPVLVDQWYQQDAPPGETFTTVGNWRQQWRDLRLYTERYTWSKDQEWAKFIDLPARTGQSFELALGSYTDADERMLRERGWSVRRGLDISSDPWPYREYVRGSRGEFTVAKDQNVRLRTGWFSDRSATYLAAGRPVVTQDTGFGCVLPTGSGLFAVSDVAQAADAIEAINRDYEAHCRGALDIAREYFEAEKVLGQLLGDVGLTVSGARPGPRTSPPGPGSTRAANGRVRSVNGQAAGRSPITTRSSVAALIPHFRCEEWLEDCLDSLLNQTRALEAVIVIDDASVRPPTDVVGRFDGVTLLRADRNVGPYRLIQQAIEDTQYDAYLFQDADDWSTDDRLERLLEACEDTGAELIGTQEVRVFCDDPDVVPVNWPLDVNSTLFQRPTAFCLLHPTSLVSRDLVTALGGFASGLRFSGDAEFLRRAAHVARVVNIPEYCYFRRIRPGSLTTASSTGLDSPERKRVMNALWERARANAALAADGRDLRLEPYKVADPVTLTRVVGPELVASAPAMAQEWP